MEYALIALSLTAKPALKPNASSVAQDSTYSLISARALNASPLVLIASDIVYAKHVCWAIHFLMGIAWIVGMGVIYA